MQEGFEGQSIFGPNLPGIEGKQNSRVSLHEAELVSETNFCSLSLYYVKSHSSIQLVQNVHCTEVLRMLQ